MSEETRNNETTGNGEQEVRTQAEKKVNRKWVFLTIAVIAIAAVIGTVAYTSSPSYRAGEKLKLAEKYMEELDYEQAIANFQMALDIDPANPKVIAVIESHLDEFYQQARTYAGMGEYGAEKELAAFMLDFDADYILAKLANAEADCGNGEMSAAMSQFEEIMDSGSEQEETAAVISDNLDKFYQQARLYGSQGEYESEKELAAFMLKADADNVRGKIADAEADCGIGEIEKAKASYEEAVGGGVDEEDVADGIKYCNAVLQMLAYCEEGRWEDAAAYLDSEAFTVVTERLVEGKDFVYSRNVDMLLGQKDQSIYVYSGELNGNRIDGHGTGVVSSVNTLAIYEGGWANHLPAGQGILTIWNKGTERSSGIVYEGNFAEGLLDGSIAFKVPLGDSQAELALDISQGKVGVYQVDEKENVWLTDNMDGNGTPYIVEYEKAENGVIADYLAGVPGFGGSDKVLSGRLLDIMPPVISCNLKRGYDYSGKNPIGKGIVATDNVDGDLTAQIVNESKRKASSNGMNYDDWYGLEVLYTVTDSAGNTAQLTVTYDIEDACGEWYYTVVSAK